MSKRADNEGTIRQRDDGSWEGRYSVGYTAQGKRIRRSVYGSSQEEASKKLREVLRQLDRGEYSDPSEITLSSWMDTWFNVYGRPRWRESTAAEHYRNIENNLKPRIGRHKLRNSGLNISRHISIIRIKSGERLQASGSNWNRSRLR